MSVPVHQVLLVTPVWNDSARLAVFGEELARALAASPCSIRWIIADDGSAATEHEALENLCEKFSKIFSRVEVHFAERHLGKGAVVREAWALDREAEWLAFVDADGSVAPSEILRLIESALASGTSALGIRKRTPSTVVLESPWRTIFHRGFLLTARIILKLHSEDPQCGAKVIEAASYRRIAPTLCENGLAFDCELINALKRDHSPWIEVPINWVEKRGGKVKPLRDCWGMFAALVRISLHGT
jgi:glycosyltransferase involved in cell wall biosynthesis